MEIINGLDDLVKREGQDLGVSPWFELTQADVTRFADLTRDHQWVHVDVARAADSEFGGTIAHGFLTLSLLTHLQHGVFEVREITKGLNYGLDRVRFPAPALVGSSVRARVSLLAVDDRGDSVQVKYRTVVEGDRSERPVCVADSVVLYFGPRRDVTAADSARSL